MLALSQVIKELVLIKMPVIIKGAVSKNLLHL